MTGSFFFQNVVSFSDAVHLMCNIFIWNWSNTMNVKSALWILMAWCFSTRASVATVLTTHPCVSRCLRVKTSPGIHLIMNYIFWDHDSGGITSAISTGYNNNKSALVQVMAWCQRGAKPLCEPMMAQFIEEYASLCLKGGKKVYGFGMNYKEIFSQILRIIEVLIEPDWMWLVITETLTQWAHDTILPSLLRLNNIVTLFSCKKNYVTIALCVRWQMKFLCQILFDYSGETT